MYGLIVIQNVMKEKKRDRVVPILSSKLDSLYPSLPIKSKYRQLRSTEAAKAQVQIRNATNDLILR